MLRRLVTTVLCGSVVLISAAARPAPDPKPEPPLAPVRVPQLSLPRLVDGKLIRDSRQNGVTVNVDLSQQILNISMPKEILWRTKGQFVAGDLIRVKQKSALRRETTDLATVKAGQYLTVSNVHPDGKWVEAGTLENGKVVRGWLQAEVVEFIAAEPRLEPSLRNHGWNEFAAAALLGQKAKQFDDGLMAAVQLAAQSGHCKFAGKKLFLEKFSQHLPADKSSTVVWSACLLGKVPVQIPAGNRQSVDASIAEFLNQPWRSEPISFYTWNANLTSLFQQDRMLQTDLTEGKGTDVVALARALHADPDARKAYESWLTLQARLTNPQVNADLRPLLTALDEQRTPDVARGTRIFPPSYSHEIDLLKRMFPDGIVPAGFQLMEAIVAQVKSGQLDLTPRPDSGWYDQQLWSLEPYLRPHGTPEGSRWSADHEYHEHLVKLFKGMYALARETQIKDVEVPLAPSAARPGEDEPEPKIQVYVDPQLSAEPIATSYLRRARGYRFVREALAEQFGPDSLTELHRLTAAGPVTVNLDDELRQMEAIFLGAFVVVTRQLGLPEPAENDVGSGAGGEADAAAFLNWSANLHRDTDLGTDARMMVPLYFDPAQQKTKVWVFLGWSSQRMYVTFARNPSISVVDKAGKPVDPQRLEVRYHAASYQIETPVFQELYVSKLLNRDEFRKHCDAYGSTAAILKNLE